MRPNFALDLGHDGIVLLHRASGGRWTEVGRVGLDDQDLRGSMSYLRATATGLEGRGFATRLIIPESQVLYDTVYAPGPDIEERHAQIAATLEGRTPYAVEDLVFDWVGDDNHVHIAVVARETLEEAESFAAEHRFNPVAFAASPDPQVFPGEAFFGATHASEGLLGPGAVVERERESVRPQALQPEPPTDPIPNLLAEPAPQAPLAAVSPTATAPDTRALAEPEPMHAQQPPDEEQPRADEPPAAAWEEPTEATVEPQPAAAFSSSRRSGVSDVVAPQVTPTLSARPSRLGFGLKDQGGAAEPDASTDRTVPPVDARPELEAGQQEQGQPPATRSPAAGGIEMPEQLRRLIERRGKITPTQPVARPEVGASGGAARREDALPSTARGDKDLQPRPLRTPPKGSLREKLGVLFSRKPPEGTAPPGGPRAMLRPLPPAPPPPTVKMTPSAAPAIGTPASGAMRPDMVHMPVSPATAVPVTGLRPGASVLPAVSDTQAREDAAPDEVAQPIRQISGRRAALLEALGARARLVLRARVPAPRTGMATPEDSAGGSSPRPSALTRALDGAIGLGTGLGTTLGTLAGRSGDILLGLRTKARPAPSSTGSATPQAPQALAADDDRPSAAIVALAERRRAAAGLSPEDEKTKGRREDGDFGLLSRLEPPRNNARLGLILTVLLVLGLIALALWSGSLVEPRLSRWFSGTPETSASAADTDPSVATSLPVTGPSAPEPLPDVSVEEEALAALSAIQAENEAAARAGLGVTLPETVAPAQEPVAGTLAEDGEADLASLSREDLSPEELADLAEAEGLISEDAADTPEAPQESPPPSIAELYEGFNLPSGLAAPAPALGPDYLDDLYVAGRDPASGTHDPAALPPVATRRGTESTPPAESLPPPPGTVFELGADGLVEATPEGSLTPAGITVFSRRPDVAPPARAATEEVVAPDPLAGMRPAPRPENLRARIEDQESSLREELRRIAPRARPESVQSAEAPEDSGATALAVASSRRPSARPADFETRVAAMIAARPAEEEPASTARAPAEVAAAPATAGPAIPTSASVARAATERRALRLSDINLIGTYGTQSAPRALVRLSSGRFVRVETGDRLDGGQVAAIGDGTLRYVKGGRTVTLRMPN